MLMSLFITSLNSGSNGNCYYVGNHDEAILVDAGISCRETEKRMLRLGLSITKVRAIFVSHEHGDHITGLTGLSRKFKIPVFITPETLLQSKLPLSPELVTPFTAGVPVNIGSLEILAFAKSHDAIDPHSFVISCGDTRVGVFTDIGNCCAEVIKYFSICQAVFLESNYCEDMLENGNYPYHLKRRIRSNDGHLSNAQALKLFIDHRCNELSHLVLSHLSKNNNCPKLVDRLFRQHAGNTNIIVASRYEETPVYTVLPGDPVSLQNIAQQEPPVANIPARRKALRKAQKSSAQLSLF